MTRHGDFVGSHPDENGSSARLQPFKAATNSGCGSGALDERVEARVSWQPVEIEYLGGSEVPRSGAPFSPWLEYDYGRGARGNGHLRDKDTDRTGTGDVHARPGTNSGFASGRDRHGERLDECGCVV